MSKSLLLLLMTMKATFALNFSVSTQNLWHYTTNYDERLDSLSKNIDFEKADIMSFQEAWTSFSGKSLYSEYVSDPSLSINFLKTNNTIVIKEGLSIASKFEHVGERFAFKLPHSKRFFGKRMMQVSTLKIPQGPEVYIINVHFSPFGDKKNERIDQLNFVIDKIQNTFNDRPVIITGDFNQDEDQDFFSPLKAIGFRSSATKAEVGCTFCETNIYTDEPFNSKLDYIFYQSDIFKVESVRKIFVENPISDHYGMRAELSLL